MESRTETVTLDGLRQFAAQVLNELPETDGTTVIGLTGDLGAGKTAFVKALAETLGVTEIITSPTFTIMQSYETTHGEYQRLIHMDAYRIEDQSELGPLRFNELLQEPNTIFCIEWAELITDALPADAIQLHFSIAAEPDTRSVRISF